MRNPQAQGQAGNIRSLPPGHSLRCSPRPAERASILRPRQIRVFETFGLSETSARRKSKYSFPKPRVPPCSRPRWPDESRKLLCSIPRMAFCHFVISVQNASRISGKDSPRKISGDSRATGETQKESRYLFRLSFRLLLSRAVRKKLRGASPLQAFPFLRVIPHRRVFFRQIKILKAFEAIPSAAGRTFPAQDTDIPPPFCAKRKISFRQTIFR